VQASNSKCRSSLNQRGVTTANAFENDAPKKSTLTTIIKKYMNIKPDPDNRKQW
jgi:hypothetical protein